MAFPVESVQEYLHPIEIEQNPLVEMVKTYIDSGMSYTQVSNLLLTNLDIMEVPNILQLIFDLYDWS